MATKQMRMKAPKGTKSAFIEGHDYEVPKDGIIKVAVAGHVETLQRHGFVEVEDKATAEQVDAMTKDELIEFIESHGEDADDMNKKELRAKAHELVEANSDGD